MAGSKSKSAAAAAQPPPPQPSTIDDPDQSDPLAGVPELSSYRTTLQPERVDALKLIADSVAQQRQTANAALIASPANLGALVALAAVVARTVREFGYDWSLALVTVAGLAMSALAVCRFATQDYLWAAEKVNFDWLRDGADVYVTKFGDEVIGTAVVEWVPVPPPGEEAGGATGTRAASKKKKAAVRGEIRAWTVRLRYRNKSVGSALLEDVVKVARAKGAEGVVFADDHANAKRVLPSFYNGVFDRRDRKSRDLLQSILEEEFARGKKK